MHSFSSGDTFSTVHNQHGLNICNRTFSIMPRNHNVLVQYLHEARNESSSLAFTGPFLRLILPFQVEFEGGAGLAQDPASALFQNPAKGIFQAVLYQEWEGPG